MDALEFTLRLLCLEAVVVGFKNSKQHGTTKALTGVFAGMKMGPFPVFSQVTLPDALAQFLLSSPGKQAGKFGRTVWSMMQL